MKLLVEIETTGAAFCDEYSGEQDDFCRHEEVARILSRVWRDVVDRQLLEGPLHDSYGNNVGRFEVAL